MRYISTLVALALPAFAMAGGDHGSRGDGPVAEIVTFRLVDGADEAAFLAAARGMEPFLRDTGAVVRRTLSKGADGGWTDHIIWTSLSAAEAAAPEIHARPEAAQFMALIQQDGEELRHEHILMQME